MMVDEDVHLEFLGSMLREVCVETHNELSRDLGGYSELGEVIRTLPSQYPKLEHESERHLMLSSYTFWGSRKVGGSRRGLERRLERATSDELWALHERLRAGVFAAWRCVEVFDDGRSRWESVGPARSSEVTVKLVTDGRSDAVAFEVGDIRAGWAVDFGGDSALMFTLELSDQAAKLVEEAASENAWCDEQAPSGNEVRVVEYERDVLSQATAPAVGTCGLEPNYYLPATLRTKFPPRFRRSLLRTLIDTLGTQSKPWHVRVATAGEASLRQTIVERLDALRAKARRRAQHSYEHTVANEVLERVVGDEECLAMIGLTEKGRVDLGRFPPVKLHPVSMLDVDWTDLEERGVKSDARVHSARTQLEKVGDDELRQRFEVAVEAHRTRLRWCAVVRTVQEGEQYWSRWILELNFNELMIAVDEVFGPTIAEMSLRELLAEQGRVCSRLENSLEKANCGSKPFVVGDLPRGGREFSDIRGVGTKTFDAVQEALYLAVYGWADSLDEFCPDDDDEARSEIEAGLDALDDLF